MIYRFEYYLERKVFEWVMSVSMFLLAIEIYIWPVTLKSSAFRHLSEVISTEFIGIFLFVVGSVRIFAMFLNGHSFGTTRIGPLLRSFLAVICAVMWSQFALSLLELSTKQGYPSPGLPFWTMFVFGELYVAYKAALNARRTD